MWGCQEPLILERGRGVILCESRRHAAGVGGGAEKQQKVPPATGQPPHRHPPDLSHLTATTPKWLKLHADETLWSTLYLTHGGGPMPLTGEMRHEGIIKHFETLPPPIEPALSSAQCPVEPGHVRRVSAISIQEELCAAEQRSHGVDSVR